MEENNNENQQYKFDDADRPFNYGKKFGNDFDWKNPGHGPGPGMFGPGPGMFGPGMFGPGPGMFGPGPCPYGQKCPGGYGPYFPNNYGIYGLPWFLLALKSISPRDLMKYKEEVDNMD